MLQDFLNEDQQLIDFLKRFKLNISFVVLKIESLKNEGRNLKKEV
jgi:hypothetical protein